MQGIAVEVIRRTRGYDEHGEKVDTTVKEIVGNVLVAPGATQDVVSTIQDGVHVAYSLCFPKGYTASLKGASVILDGVEYSVIGDPKPMTANCPTAWNRNVYVEVQDG